ncbi:MAG: hypothetical protein SGPRY_000711 [Prymnesium sp.]
MSASAGRRGGAEQLVIDTSCGSQSEGGGATPSDARLGSVLTSNSAERDDDCWVWELRVSSAELQIEGVTMKLHPTFKPNVAVMTKMRDGSFTSGELRGWATFPVGLQLTTCGQMHVIEHMLAFSDENTEITHELSSATLHSRERRTSAERASAIWRSPRSLDPVEAKRQKQSLKELREAQREFERAGRRKRSGSNSTVAAGAAPSSSDQPATVNKSNSGKSKAATSGRESIPKLSPQQKVVVTATARALLESISELAAAGDAAGVAKACALLHEDCIEAFSEVEGEDDGIREFAERAIQDYADFLEKARPSVDELRQLGARAIAGFLQRTFGQ